MTYLNQFGPFLNNSDLFLTYSTCLWPVWIHFKQLWPISDLFEPVLTILKTIQTYSDLFGCYMNQLWPILDLLRTFWPIFFYLFLQFLIYRTYLNQFLTILTYFWPITTSLNQFGPFFKQFWPIFDLHDCNMDHYDLYLTYLTCLWPVWINFQQFGPIFWPIRTDFLQFWPFYKLYRLISKAIFFEFFFVFLWKKLNSDWFWSKKTHFFT